MKKIYIAPEIELVRLSSVSVMAASPIVSDKDEINGDNMGDYDFNSNSFQGGVSFWEE